MKQKNIIDEVLKSDTIRDVSKTVRGYFKWIVFGGLTLLILGFVVTILLLVGLAHLIISPLLSKTPTLTQQGQTIMTEGQKWWEQRFNQEQKQLQDIQRQLNEVKQAIDQQNQQEQLEGNK